MNRQDYMITIKGLSPIQFSRRHEALKEKGESADLYERRTWDQKARYDDQGNVLVSADALTTMLVAGAIRMGMKFKGLQKFGAVFKGGVIVTSPMKIGKRTSVVQNEVGCDATGASSLTRTPGKQVFRVFPMLQQWEGTYRVHVLRPEITEDVLKEHAEFAHAFIGLGSFRPQNGRGFGRAEVVSVKPVRQVTV